MGCDHEKVPNMVCYWGGAEMSKIRKNHPSCICAICDNEVAELDGSSVVFAYGSQYLVHADCGERIGTDQWETEDEAKAALLNHCQSLLA